MLSLEEIKELNKQREETERKMILEKVFMLENITNTQHQDCSTLTWDKLRRRLTFLVEKSRCG